MLPIVTMVLMRFENETLHIGVWVLFFSHLSEEISEHDIEIWSLLSWIKQM